MSLNQTAFEVAAEEELTRICENSRLREDVPPEIVQAMLGDSSYDLARQHPAVVVLLGDTESRIAAKTIMAITAKARRGTMDMTITQQSVSIH